MLRVGFDYGWSDRMYPTLQGVQRPSNTAGNLQKAGSPKEAGFMEGLAAGLGCFQLDTRIQEVPLPQEKLGGTESERANKPGKACAILVGKLYSHSSNGAARKNLELLGHRF